MERLLADATAISGIEYDISSYADVVDAIHVIQESMGVAGATAAEAEHTIEGSLNSMKAAVANLVVGFFIKQIRLISTLSESVFSRTAHPARSPKSETALMSAF